MMLISHSDESDQGWWHLRLEHTIDQAEHSRRAPRAAVVMSGVQRASVLLAHPPSSRKFIMLDGTTPSSRKITMLDGTTSDNHQQSPHQQPPTAHAESRDRESGQGQIWRSMHLELNVSQDRPHMVVPPHHSMVHSSRSRPFSLSTLSFRFSVILWSPLSSARPKIKLFVILSFVPPEGMMSFVPPESSI